MRRLVLKSPAKINLYLKVISKRSDGYHSINTLFERISLCDTIALEYIPQDKIEVCCGNADVPRDETNLAFIAASLLKKDFSITSGVRINIKKSIPVSSGLGGGSSNAACVLLGLNKLWGLKLEKKALIRYAKRIGADVAFFIADKSFAVGLARGDNIQPLGINRVFWHVLAVKNVKLSSRKIYKDFDVLSFRVRKDLRLTKPIFNIKIINRLLKGSFLDLKPLIYNSLEPIVVRRHKSIFKIIKIMEESGALSGMSGSGPTVFGIVSGRAQAEKIKEKLAQLKDLKVFITKTC